MTNPGKKPVREMRAHLRRLKALVRKGKVLLLETTDAHGNYCVEAIPQPNLQGAA